MSIRSLRWIANAFVLSYAADACLSGLDDVVRALAGSTALAGPRHELASAVLWAALLMPFALTVTPRLPTALCLLLSASALWLNFGAAPLLLLVPSPAWFGPTAVAIQLAVSALAFAWIRRRNGGAGWLLRDTGPAGRVFSLPHSLTCIAALLFIGLPAVAIYVLIWSGTWIQFASHGFVAFDASGAVLADRHYTRGDREVRLVGMMHIGEEDAYSALVHSFAGDDTAVLQEGVTDDEDRLHTPLSYKRAAAALGLEAQQDLQTYFEEDPVEDEHGPVFIHADVDAASFAPETIAWLEQIARTFAAADRWRAFRALGAWSSARAGEWPIVVRDLLTRRNEHLVAQLDDALARYPHVIVPWGAMHMPAIEAAVLERGFVPAGATRHTLLHWRGIAARILELFR